MFESSPIFLTAMYSDLGLPLRKHHSAGDLERWLSGPFKNWVADIDEISWSRLCAVWNQQEACIGGLRLGSCLPS